MTKETKNAGAGKSPQTPRKARTSAAGGSTRKSKPETPSAESETGRVITREERWKMIAEAAYYLAEKRDFGGDPTEDWRAAEAEIDAKLVKQGR